MTRNIAGSQINTLSHTQGLKTPNQISNRLHQKNTGSELFAIYRANLRPTALDCIIYNAGFAALAARGRIGNNSKIVRALHKPRKYV